jgi:transcriptional regulator with XRE-family HTH domain
VGLIVQLLGFYVLIIIHLFVLVKHFLIFFQKKVYFLGIFFYNINIEIQKRGQFMAIDIEKWKKAKKEKKLSYDDLAAMTGYSRSTITNIFCGYIDLPRHETIQAIERALGLDTVVPAPETSEEERRLVALLNELTEDEILELSNYVDFLIAKRK